MRTFLDIRELLLRQCVRTFLDIRELLLRQCVRTFLDIRELPVLLKQCARKNLDINSENTRSITVPVLRQCVRTFLNIREFDRQLFCAGFGYSCRAGVVCYHALHILQTETYNKNLKRC